MSAFYICGECGNEFLGRDDIPVDDDNCIPVCRRCQIQYEYCIVCDISFRFHESGDPSGDLCNDCWEGNDRHTREYYFCSDCGTETPDGSGWCEDCSRFDQVYEEWMFEPT